MAKPAIIDVSKKDAVLVENIDYFVKKDCFKDKTIIDYTFNNCTFNSVNFAGARLYMCKFNNCTFERCNFNNAVLRQSDFTTSIFKCCIHWDTANLRFAQFNKEFKEELINLVFKKVFLSSKMDKKADNLKSFLATFCESENIVLSKELKLLWLGELMQEDAEAVKQACVNIMTGKHKVYGKITLKNILEQLRGNTEQDAQLQKEKLEKQAEDAYIEFRRCIRSISPYSNFKHKDKALVACVEELGGWYAITNKTRSELDFMKNNFIARYKQNTQADSDSLPEQVIGFAEQQNNRKISRGAVNMGSLKVV